MRDLTIAFLAAVALLCAACDRDETCADCERRCAPYAVSLCEPWGSATGSRVVCRCDPTKPARDGGAP